MLDKVVSIVQGGLILFKLAGIGLIQDWSWLKVLALSLCHIFYPIIYALIISGRAIFKEAFKKEKTKG